MRVPRSMIALATGLLAVSALRATTLEHLSLSEMAQKSTSIVRARVAGSHSANRDGAIYTYFQLQVLETWKASGTTISQSATEVAVPGGVADGIRQIATGVPDLKVGQEYVLFLWTSRSGLTQVMGLSQGRFHVFDGIAQRPPASELMLDRSGHPVDDSGVNLHLDDLCAQVRRALRQNPEESK
jgi:hypothetical protein